MHREILSFFVGISLLLGGCKSAEDPAEKDYGEKILRLNLGGEPRNLDPRRARELSSLIVLRMLFEGLTRVDAEGRPQLALAEKVDISEGGKKYTFRLREAYWSSGDLVTAQDFVSSWKSLLDPAFPSDNVFFLYLIQNAQEYKEGYSEDLGARALDDKTLEVALTRAVPYFLEALSAPPFFPVSKGEAMVFNGPFRINEWKHHDRILLEKNPRYWDREEVHLETVELVMVDEETELKLFEKGLLDWAGSPLSTLPVNALRFLKKKGQLQSKPFLGTYFLRTQIGKAPFDHPLVRRAFALAVDRRGLIDHVLQGDQVVATGLVPFSMGLQKEAYFKDGDAGEARRVLEKALDELKITREEFPEVVLTYPSGERSRLIAQVLQQQWLEGLDIPVKLEALEGKVYFDRVSHQDFQLATGSWIADYNDPLAFLEVFQYREASTNNTGWEDPEYIRLLGLAAREPEKRGDFLRESEKLLMEAMPIIPIFHYTMLYVANPDLKGVVVSPMGVIDFKWAYKQKE
eukprot:Opistho-1_new@101388